MNPLFTQINLAVQNMEATITFYRKLGLIFDAEPEAFHVTVTFPNGMLIDFDSIEFVKQWDSGWKPSTGGSVVLGFSVPSREAVDQLYDDMTGAGYRGHQPPYDTFFGARYAIIEDPDGNSVGLMSPRDKQRNFWPPSIPPSIVNPD